MTKYTSERERYARRVQEEINGYTTQLVSDNEALRVNAASLRVEMQKLRDQVALLEEERAGNEARERQLRNQLSNIEARQDEVAREQIRMERRNAELTHLYVACHRLHEGAGRGDLFQAIEEILGSIVGCEEYAIYEVDSEAGALSLAASVGLEAPAARLSLGTGRIGFTATGCEVWIAPGGVPGVDDGITACVPLVRGGRAIAVIALYGLLEHKPQLGEVEREVFEILVQQAGAALHCADCSEKQSTASAGREA